ncbi:MAG TPA: response regulator [Kofleriaceae bacterium]|jgi:CheY-like chemotaxis protein|nr:response regulator [Kofleriaceae bacterium]
MRAPRQLILVVDDDPDISDVLSDVLTLLGFRVATASDGVSALDRLDHEAQRPAVIVLDLIMPGMDGHALGLALRADPRFASIPIVILSASNEAATVAAELHADSVVPKPLHLTVLRNAISHAIEHGVAA